MTVGGWIMLLASWGIIIGLAVYCYAKVFRIERENITPIFEIDTGDLNGKSKDPNSKDKPGPEKK